MLLRMQEQELDTSREANDKTCTETALSQPSLKLSLLSDHENLIESAIDRIVHETQSVYLHNVSHSRSSPLLLQLDELSTSLLTDTHRPPYIVDDDGKSVVSAAYSSVSDDDDSSRFSLLRLLSESGRLDRFLESPLMPLLQNQMLNEAWRTNRHEVVLLNIANLVARGHLISARYLLMLLQRLVHNLCVCVCCIVECFCCSFREPMWTFKSETTVSLLHEYLENAKLSTCENERYGELGEFCLEVVEEAMQYLEREHGCERRDTSPHIR